MSAISGGQCRSPSQATIRGSAHLDEIAKGGVVKLRITIAVERAAGRIIAHSAVLVVEITLRLHHDRIAPGEALVHRAADEHVHIRRGPRGDSAEVADDPA